MSAFLEKFFNINPLMNVRKWGKSYFYPISGGGNFSNYNLIQQFLTVPELNAIINIKARAMANWRLEIISDKTGLPVSGHDTLARILRKPNHFQTAIEFWRQSDVYRSVYGNEFIYFLTPVGMPNTVKAMYTLDPGRIQIRYESDLYYFNEIDDSKISYYYEENGRRMPLDKNNLIHLNDNRVYWESINDIYSGASRLESLQPAIQNIIAAYKKRNIMLNMPVGIMTNTASDGIGLAMPMDEEEKLDVTSKLQTNGALPIITNLQTSYTSMVNSPQSMGLFEETREDTAKICDAYGVPYELLASQKGTTFTNLKEAKKQHYEDSIIPDANEKLEALNDKFSGKTWQVSADYKHLAVFADDQKQRAISLKQMVDALSKALDDGAISLEQYSAELNKFGI